MKRKAGKPSALGYYGGKSPNSRTGPWIASLLPKGKVYAEPFAGMAGVLLCRKPVKAEFLNDLDDRIVNWWRVVRDQPKEFERLVANTPWSRAMYNESRHRIKTGKYREGNLLRQALDTHIVVEQSIAHGLNPGGWRMNTSGPVSRKQVKKRIEVLAERMHGVQLENADAVDFTIRLMKSKSDELVLYLDPPYAGSGAHVDSYGKTEFDVDRLSKTIRECKGFVAISGYKGEWDHLGWHRYEFKTSTKFVNLETAKRGGKKEEKRTEVLWTNKPAVGMPTRTLM